MLHPDFLYHRELLGDLARLAYDTVREMMAAAIEEPGARPGWKDGEVREEPLYYQ